MEIPESTIRWLLGDDNPPVRYYTQTDLLALDPAAPEVRATRARLMDYHVTKAILAAGDAFWHGDAPYWKYTGRYWQVIFLGWFLADGSGGELRQGIDGILADRGWVSAAGGQCLTANILAALARMGYRDHPEVRKEIESLAKRVVDAGGVACHVMDYSLLTHCHMSIPKLLLCFSLVPTAERSTRLQRAISLLRDQLIRHQVFRYVPGNRAAWQRVLESAPKRKDLPEGQTVKAWVAERKEAFLREQGLGERNVKRGWLKFGFPKHYNSDTLEAMYALSRVDARMGRELRAPLDVVRDKSDAEGRWIMEDSLNGKMLVDVERKGEPSKWLTYFGLATIKHFDELHIA